MKTTQANKLINPMPCNRIDKRDARDPAWVYHPR